MVCWREKSPSTHKQQQVSKRETLFFSNGIRGRIRIVFIRKRNLFWHLEEGEKKKKEKTVLIFTLPQASPLLRKKKMEREGLKENFQDLSLPKQPFTISKLLDEARIMKEDRKKLEDFLKWMKVTQDSLDFLTKELLFESAEKYKQKNPEFDLAIMDAAKIAHAALNWEKKEDTSKFFQIFCDPLKGEHLIKRQRLTFRKSDKYFEQSAFHLVNFMLGC